MTVTFHPPPSSPKMHSAFLNWERVLWKAKPVIKNMIKIKIEKKKKKKGKGKKKERKKKEPIDKANSDLTMAEVY